MTKSDLEKAVTTAVNAERERCVEICREKEDREQREIEGYAGHTNNHGWSAAVAARDGAASIRRAILGEDE